MSRDATDALPRAYGPLLGRARMRASPDDFSVDEILGFRPTGHGEHLFVWIRKRERTTEQVAGLLARTAGVPRGAVSYAGMKDRRAVTQQWFSIHLPGREIALSPGELEPGVEVIEAVRHDKKLRRGVLRGNRFRLRLRDVAAPSGSVSQRLVRIARWGVPNYFGEQRFARDGDNVEQARAMLGGRLRPRNRSLRGILLSAARSHLFNRLLAERLRQGNWATALPGDLLMLDGRHSLFPIDAVDEVIRRRVRALEIHPTGPLSGRGGAQPAGEAVELERRVLSDELELIEGLSAAGLEGARRALRLRVADLGWWFPAPGEVELAFALTAGAYATGVVRELFEVD
jgi:tRNA pseudouridine13 synthase